MPVHFHIVILAFTVGCQLETVELRHSRSLVQLLLYFVAMCVPFHSDILAFSGGCQFETVKLCIPVGWFVRLLRCFGCDLPPCVYLFTLELWHVKGMPIRNSETAQFSLAGSFVAVICRHA